MTVSGNASGMTGTIYAPAAQLTESGNASLNAALIVDTLTISGNGVANAVTLDSPSGTVAYTPAQIRAAYGISSLRPRRHRPDHRHRRRLRRPGHLPGPRRLRHPVRPDRLRADAVRPVRPGLVVPDRAQSGRPGHLAARAPTRTAPAPPTGKWRKHSTSSGPMPSRPARDHPRRGRQPVAVRPDGRRGHRRQPAGGVGGVDELGLPRGPGRLRRR